MPIQAALRLIPDPRNPVAGFMASESVKTHEQDASDAQVRLMRMLESVRLEETEIPAKPEVSSGPGCPNCGSLEPRGSASWCSACGYYPKLGRTVVQREAEETPPADLWQAVPRWICWLAAGLAIIFLQSLLFRILLADPPIRGLVALVQLGLGLALFSVGHLRAYFIASAESDKVSIGSIFFAAGTLWQPVLRRLPATRRTVYAGSWGMTACLGAVLIVGLNWNALLAVPQKSGRPKAPSPLKWVMAMAGGEEGAAAAVEEEDRNDQFPIDEAAPAADLAKGGGGGAGSIEDAVADLGGAADVNSLKAAPPGPQTMQSAGHSEPDESDGRPGSGGSAESGKDPHLEQAPSGEAAEEEAPPSADPKRGTKGEEGPKAGVEKGPPAVEFRIFGYLANGQGELRSLLLAEVVEGNRARFGGRLSLDQTERSLRKRLQATLEGLRVPRPALSSPYHGRWVRPVIVCRVTYNGRTPDGVIREGVVLDFHDISEPRSDSAVVE